MRSAHNGAVAYSGCPGSYLTSELLADAEDAIGVVPRPSEPKAGIVRRRTWGADGPALSKAISIERVATTVGTVFVLGKTRAGVARQPPAPPRPTATGLPMLSKQVTIGRNSQFLNLTSSDRERLGGIEYRALKVLLKIVVCKSNIAWPPWAVVVSFSCIRTLISDEHTLFFSTSSG